MRKLIVLLLAITAINFAQEVFELEVEKPAKNIEQIDVLMTRWNQPASDILGVVIPDSFIVSYDIVHGIYLYDEDGKFVKVIRGNLIPHLTNQEKLGQKGFMDKMAILAEPVLPVPE